MSLKIPCPRCRKSLAFDATKCPHCHSELTAEETAQRKTSVGIGCVTLAAIAAVIFVISSFSGEDEPETPSFPPIAAKSDAPPPAAVAVLPVKLEQVRERFNATAQQLGEEWRMPLFERENDSFKVMVTPDFGLVGVTQGDEVVSVTALSTGDGSLRSGVDAIMMNSIVIGAILDIQDMKETGPLFMELSSDFNPAEGERTLVRDGIEMTFSRSELVGNILEFRKIE